MKESEPNLTGVPVSSSESVSCEGTKEPARSHTSKRAPHGHERSHDPEEHQSH